MMILKVTYCVIVLLLLLSLVNCYIEKDQLNFYFHDNDDKSETLAGNRKMGINNLIPDAQNYGSFYIKSNLDNNYLNTPEFVTNKKEFLIEKPEFYIQKISRDSREDFNRYEEIALNNNNNNSSTSKSTEKTTRKRINAMLMKYLGQLLIEKYGINKTDQAVNKTIIQLNDNHYNNKSAQLETESINPQLKFIYGTYNNNNYWSNWKNKLKQFFNLFTIIKFNNTECNATNWAGTWQGVCLTQNECEEMNGLNLGNCAQGYGVCCVFRGTCGDSSSRNCTYFKSPNYPDYYPSDGGVVTPTTIAPIDPTPDPRNSWFYWSRQSISLNGDNTRSCIYTVYKMDSNIQQMRIDFIDLDLSGPTNGTCTAERLIITGQNSNNEVPILCGYNTGQHIYIDVSELNGPLQIMILSATGIRKRFKIKICQFANICSTSQSNCLQYYTGISGIIESFNYDQAATYNRSFPGYFNNLNYAICIRRESGYCSITYTNVQNGQENPFQFVNIMPNGQSTLPRGEGGVDILNCPDDYLIIDGTRLCGDRFNDGSTTVEFNRNAPVTDSSNGPILIHVRTNANITGMGFKLNFMQNLCS